MTMLACIVGACAVAYFHGCDPVKSGEVRTQDQVTILLAQRVLGQWPGMMGLFVATLCSGTLSTVSSGLSSGAAVLWQDFVLVRFFCVSFFSTVTA